MVKSNSKKWAIGAALAAGAGYLTGVLTAPKSGKETRQEIQRTAIKAKSEMEKKLKELHHELDSGISSGQDKLKTAKTSAKKELDSALRRAESAKLKSREILTALRDGGSSDKDLKKAVNEANAAVKHLKQFLINNAEQKAKK